MDNLFFGQGLNFFFGVVEDNNDVLGLGRVKVRVIGHHNPDQVELPTEALPYASVIHSTDNPVIGGVGDFKRIPIGCRVFGFFIDGESRQQLAILGTLSGESMTFPADMLPVGATPQLPNIDPIIGESADKETSCPSGVRQGSVSVNSGNPDYRGINFDRSKFCYPCTGYVSDTYGSRQGRHKGVDIATVGKQLSVGASRFIGQKYRGPTNIPVYAVADGVVFYKFKKSLGQGGVTTQYDRDGRGSRSFGNAIVIRHEIDGIVMLSIYAHLGVNQDAALDTDDSGIMVSIGDTVKKGQQIGTVGRTHVRDVKTHLHFELRIGEALTKGANNTIPPWVIFPKMANKDTAMIATVESSLSWRDIPYTNKEAPMRGGEQSR